MRLLRILLSALSLALICSCAENDQSRESFGDKTEWSILQAAEFQSRGMVVATYELGRVQDYTLLGVPDSSGKKTIWIMLHPKSSPYYKQMPSGTYTISKEILGKLVRDRRLSPTVEEVLSSHVVE